MYRLTLNAPTVVSQFHTQFNNLPVRRMRVYRWGLHWGYFLPHETWEKQWVVEQHEPIAESDVGIVLEKITDISSTRPVPLEIDDAWDEEVRIWNQCMCNNTLSIAGTTHEIMKICKSNNIILPLNVRKVLEEPLYNSNNAVRDPMPPLVSANPVQPSSQSFSRPPQWKHGLSKHPKPHSQLQGKQYQSMHGSPHAPRKVHISQRARGPPA